MMRSTGNFSPEWGYLAPAPSMLRTVRVVLVATAVGATAGAGVVLSLVDRSTADSDRVAVAAHAIVTSAQAAAVQESQAANGAAFIAPVAAKADVKPNVTAASASGPSQSAAVVQAAAQSPQQAHVQAAQPERGGQGATTALPPQVSSSQASPVNAASENGTSTASSSAQPAVAALSDPPVAAAATAAPSAVTSDAAAGDQSDQSFVGPQQLPQQKKPKHHTAVANNRDFIGAALRRLFSARAGGAFYPSRGL